MLKRWQPGSPCGGKDLFSGWAGKCVSYTFKAGGWVTPSNAYLDSEWPDWATVEFHTECCELDPIADIINEATPVSGTPSFYALRQTIGELYQWGIYGCVGDGVGAFSQAFLAVPTLDDPCESVRCLGPYVCRFDFNELPTYDSEREGTLWLRAAVDCDQASLIVECAFFGTPAVPYDIRYGLLGNFAYDSPHDDPNAVIDAILRLGQGETVRLPLLSPEYYGVDANPIAYPGTATLPWTDPRSFWPAWPLSDAYIELTLIEYDEEDCDNICDGETPDHPTDPPGDPDPPIGEEHCEDEDQCATDGEGYADMGFTVSNLIDCDRDFGGGSVDHHYLSILNGTYSGTTYYGVTDLATISAEFEGYGGMTTADVDMVYAVQTGLDDESVPSGGPFASYAAARAALEVAHGLCVLEVVVPNFRVFRMAHHVATTLRYTATADAWPSGNDKCFWWIRAFGYAYHDYDVRDDTGFGDYVITCLGGGGYDFWHVTQPWPEYDFTDPPDDFFQHVNHVTHGVMWDCCTRGWFGTAFRTGGDADHVTAHPEQEFYEQVGHCDSGSEKYQFLVRTEACVNVPGPQEGGAPPTTDPILHLPCQDDAGDTVVDDISTADDDAALGGGTTSGATTAGPGGTVTKAFDGTYLDANGTILLATPIGWAPTDTRSVGMFLYCDSTSPSYTLWWDSGVTFGHSLTGTTFSIQWDDSMGSPAVSLDLVTVTVGWHHIAWNIHDDGTVEVFWDGVSKGMMTGDTPITGSVAMAFLGSIIGGAVADIRVYDVEVTEAEWAAIAAEGGL